MNVTANGTMNTVFVTEQGASYNLISLDPQDAADYGCPGATVIIIGRRGEQVGTIREITGKLVRVPSWSNARKGYRAEFTPWGAPETGESFRGYIGETSGCQHYNR